MIKLTQLIQFLGAEITARNRGGALHNVVKNGLGGERTQQADSQRVGRNASTADFEAGSINIGDYEAALVYMEAHGAEPLAAKAMALVMLDAAKAQGVGVMSLLKTTSTQEVALVTNEAYKYINQLRDISSQLSGSGTIDNSKSYRSRYLLA